MMVRIRLTVGGKINSLEVSSWPRTFFTCTSLYFLVSHCMCYHVVLFKRIFSDVCSIPALNYFDIAVEAVVVIL